MLRSDIVENELWRKKDSEQGAIRCKRKLSAGGGEARKKELQRKRRESESKSDLQKGENRISSSKQRVANCSKIKQRRGEIRRDLH